MNKKIMSSKHLNIKAFKRIEDDIYIKMEYGNTVAFVIGTPQRVCDGLDIRLSKNPQTIARQAEKQALKEGCHIKFSVSSPEELDAYLTNRVPDSVGKRVIIS
jgi:hypothetical protein